MKLIVFSGLPGTGKSALAENVARNLNIPVVAKDWIEATLVHCELAPTNQDKPLGSAGYQLLTVLAERQLMLGQSVILDSVASTKSIRSIWRELAEKYNAKWLVIECVCSDEKVHRARLGTRQRRIPGWHELDWADVERVKGYYHPWDEDRLILDAIITAQGCIPDVHSLPEITEKMDARGGVRPHAHPFFRDFVGTLRCNTMQPLEKNLKMVFEYLRR